MSADVVGQKGVEMVGGLEQLLPVVDFLTIHTPLAASTLNLLGEKEFSLMKKTARVLNVVGCPRLLSSPYFSFKVQMLRLLEKNLPKLY